jgi:AcrR family transcriptional regulator
VSASHPSTSERSERRRREVWEAAYRVIIRNGLETTTMRDISREGGFTTGVLTHYFPDKHAVIVGAFIAASEDWFAELRRGLAAAGTPDEQLVALVHLALPADPDRRAEYRLWSEMWTYAGRDPDFAAQLVETDAIWELEIRGVLERAREAGLLTNIDAAAEAAVLVRLIDGLGLRAWVGNSWEDARARLVHHMGTLGVPGPVLRRMHAEEDG